MGTCGLKVYPLSIVVPPIHERRQYAVGQGFFHEGTIAIADRDADRPFLYIYDCGSLSAKLCQRALAKFKARHGSRDIDMLFISHLDQDHVNGIKCLIDQRPVKTVVLPYLDPTERVLLLAYCLARNNMLDDDYVRLVADPSSQFPGSTVIQVRAGDDPAPDFPADDRAIGRDQPLTDPEQRWHFIGQQAATSNKGATMFDSGAFVVESLDSWILAPHVVSSNAGGVKERFWKELATHPETVGFESDPTVIESLVRNHLGILRDAYIKAIGRRCLNFTSMALYSGPARLPGRVGWLGTGDAELKSRASVRRLKRHYGRHLQNIGTLALPHHGSRHNFCRDLLAAVQPVKCVSSSDPKRYGHPHAEVVNDVRAHGCSIVRVNSCPQTALVERVCLRCGPTPLETAAGERLLKVVGFKLC